MNKEPLWGHSFVRLCLSNFGLLLAFNTLVPTLPIYAMTKFSADQTQVGLIVTTFALSALASRPVAGPLMNRFGEKRVFLTAALLTLVAISLYGFGNSFETLLALRVLHGLSLGLVVSAGATMASLLIPKSRTGEGFGYYALFPSLSMGVGPFIGLTLIQSLPFSVLFLCCGLFTAIGLLCGLQIEAPSGPAPTPSHAASTPKPTSGIRAFLEPAAIPVSLCNALVAFSFGGISAFASTYGSELGLTRFTSYFFAVFALMMVLPRPWVGRLFDRVGPSVVIYPGIALFACGFWFLSQAQTGFGYLGSAAVAGLGWGALSSFLALAAQSAPSERKGYATSTFYFFHDGGIAAGSLLLGIAASRSGYQAMFLVAALVVSLTALLYFLLHDRPTARRSAQFTQQETSLSA